MLFPNLNRSLSGMECLICINRGVRVLVERKKSMTLFDSVDSLPWCDSEDVSDWECKLLAASCSDSDEQINIIRPRLLWALVHSECPEDVQCGITILQASLLRPTNLDQKKKYMYRLAVGYYRTRDYSKSMDLVHACLEISPDSSSAILLKKVIENTVMKGGVNGICTPSVHVVTGFVRARTFKKLIEDLVEKDPNSNPSDMKEEMFLLAHRYYIRGDYARSRLLVDYCLRISPEWKRPIALKKSIKHYEILNIYIGGISGVAIGFSLAVGVFFSLKRQLTQSM